MKYIALFTALLAVFTACQHENQIKESDLAKRTFIAQIHVSDELAAKQPGARAMVNAFSALNTEYSFNSDHTGVTTNLARQTPFAWHLSNDTLYFEPASSGLQMEAMLVSKTKTGYQWEGGGIIYDLNERAETEE